MYVQVNLLFNGAYGLLEDFSLSGRWTFFCGH
jgi:hypothetical protein